MLCLKVERWTMDLRSIIDTTLATDMKIKMLSKNLEAGLSSNGPSSSYISIEIFSE
jgi:hypothetical protein